MASDTKLSVTQSFFVFPAAVTMIAVMWFLMIPFGIFDAWIKVHLWTWFAVPYLHAPQITLWPMYGINCIVTAFKTVTSSDSKKDENENGWDKSMKMIGQLVIGPLLLLFTGYAIHLWMIGN